jgi:hypothetical protein
VSIITADMKNTSLKPREKGKFKLYFLSNNIYFM